MTETLQDRIDLKLRTAKVKKPKLPQEQQAALRTEYVEDPKATLRSLAAKYQVSTGTVYNILKKNPDAEEHS